MTIIYKNYCVFNYLRLSILYLQRGVGPPQRLSICTVRFFFSGLPQKPNTDVRNGLLGQHSNERSSSVFHTGLGTLRLQPLIGSR